MFRYTKRVWPTVEKKKGRKKKSLSKFPNGEESLSEGRLAAVGPPGCSNIQHPHWLPRLFFPTWLELILPSTPHAKSAFPNKTYKNTKKKTLQRSERQRNFLEPSTFKPKTCLSKYKCKKTNKKRLGLLQPITRRPLKHFLIHLREGMGGVNWAIITFHSSRFNESSHGEYRDALEWSLD